MPLMKSALSIAAALVALVAAPMALGADAPAPAPEPTPTPAYGPFHPGGQYRVESSIRRQCFNGELIAGASRAGERTVYVQTPHSRIYELQLAETCTALDAAEKLSLRTHGNRAVCVGARAQLVVDTPAGPRRCNVAKVHGLTSDKLAALAAAPQRPRP
jgi:hypothetical protein